MSLKGKTLFITGGSRGIGLALALRAARDGANVVIAAKTAEPHPKLPGTIFTAAKQIEAAGGRALPLVVDVRDENALQEAAHRSFEAFGGIDICVNNASAINLAATEDVPLSRFDLMWQVNVRGAMAAVRACLPHLRRAENPHILTFSPPLIMRPDWFAQHLPYTLSKYAMSMCALGWSAEFKQDGIASNALWPRTLVGSAAVEFVVGDADTLKHTRKPEVMADAAYAILTKPSREFSGNFLIDDDVLYDSGVRDFSVYQRAPGEELIADIFVDAEGPTPPGVKLRSSNAD